MVWEQALDAPAPDRDWNGQLTAISVGRLEEEKKPLAADNGLRQRLVAAGAGPVWAHSMDAELGRTAAFLKGEREPVDTRAATLHRATPAVPSRLTLMSPSTFRPERAVPPAR